MVQPRLAFIDALRLLAAMLVLLQHLFEGRTGFISSTLIPLAPGVAGVAIFFFISGYVIPMATRHGFEVRSFLLRRLFRIYPLYLVALILIVVSGASGLLPKLAFVAEAPPHVWVANLLLVADYVHVRPFLGVSWTLMVELVWYGLFAVSIILFGARAADRLDQFVPVSIAGMALLSLAIDMRIPTGRPTMIYAAVLGYQCYRFGAGELGKGQLARSIAIFAIISLGANYVAFGLFAHKNLTMMQAIGPWIIATLVFLTNVLWSPLRNARLLNHGLLPALGAMSYSIYLLHPFATALADAYCPRATQVPAAIGLTLCLSWLGYKCVERPAIAFGRVLADWLLRRAQIVQAA